MKRSEINAIMRDAKQMFADYRITLPPFVLWTPEEWKTKGAEVQEIKDNMLGWDITDFGQGDFSKVGLFLITIRNGNQKMADKYPKTYAEKLMIVREKQITPMHFHWNKMEDIINRAGGHLMVKVYNCGENEELADTPVTVNLDGCVKTVPAGTVLRLLPGESITLPPYQYHEFWAEKGYGPCLIGEVSMVNDDTNDNRFYEPQGRFPTIEEDEPPLYLLCHEYPAAKD